MATLGTVTYPPSPAVAWPKDTFGGYAVGFFQYAAPNAGAGGYVTGGDEVLPNAVKMGTIEFATSPVAAEDTDGDDAVIYVYNVVTNKIQAFWCAGAGAALVEVTSGADVSGFTGLFMVLGRG